MSLRSLFLTFAIILKVRCHEKQPNIILILADDLGWNDVGFHGSNQIPTPNIDALGYNGQILNRFYTLSSDSPTKAALMTGVYPIRYGFQGNSIDAGNPAFVPFKIPFLPERLKTKGYITYMVGHWDLGYSYKKATPLGRGFKKFYGSFTRHMNYFSYVSTIKDKTGYVLSGIDNFNETKTDWSAQGIYATDLYTSKAVKYIKWHDKTKPMFLYISHLAPSSADGQLQVPDVGSAVKKYKYIFDYHRRIYADAVNRLDQSVGEIMKALSKYGMLDNSIVMFMSDNGANPVEPFSNFGSNLPLRGLLETLFEGGVRVPAVLYSPLLKQKGVVNYNLMHVTDLLPTFYSAAGGNPKELGVIDGIDEWDSIKYYTKGYRENALLDIDEINKMSALISEYGKYKLINGSIKDGAPYDGYLGDKGIHPQNPLYDVKGVLTSPTNIAIQKLEKELKLDENKIMDIRKKSTVFCALPPKPKLCKTFCLFDLEKDPCETTNIIDEVPPNVVLEMKIELGKYWLEYVPQHKYIVDLTSNPIFKNGTWYPWLG